MMTTTAWIAVIVLSTAAWSAWLLFRRRIDRRVILLFETPPKFCVRDFPADDRGISIAIPTSDGLQLHGTLFLQFDRPAKGVILFCHEFGSNSRSTMHYAEGLWRSGFDILAVDFRGHGRSPSSPGYTPSHWLTEFEMTDLAAALEFVDRHDDLKDLPLGVFGISRGGTAALALAARSPRVRCAVADGAFSLRFMMTAYSRRWLTLCVPRFVAAWVSQRSIHNTLDRARRTSEQRRGCRYVDLDEELPRLNQKPVLLIRGANDSYIPDEMLQHLIEAASRANVEAWTVPNAKHNGAVTTAPDEYARRVVAFFEEHLVEPTPAESEGVEALRQ